MGWRAWVSREECEEVGALGDSVEGGRVGERRDPGGQSWDLGMRKNWGLDKGRDGGPPGESSSFQGLFFFFQIQAFDPELWVWGRDRTLISETTEVKVGLKEGGSVSSQAQTE